MYAAKPKSNRMGRILPCALAACIGAALTASSHAVGHAPTDPAGFGTFTVTNCSDSDPGSLRDGLTTDADAIDLTQLSCSVITLTSGELSTQAESLFISGDGIAISAGGASRVLSHHGHGTLYVTGVSFTGGMVTANRALGGCLYSEGNMRLTRVYIHDCAVASTPDFTSLAGGGGIFARGLASLDGSSVRDNAVMPAGGAYSYARGGGIYANSVTLRDSTVSGNNAGGFSVYSEGGGVLARTSLNVAYSTISGNNAYFAGGAAFGTTYTTSSISNSTISGNTAKFRTAGLSSNDGFLRVSNSTIAFNEAERSFCGGGLITFGLAEYLSLNNSIIANNSDAGVSDDLCIQPFQGGGIIGSTNIVISANVALPPDTIRDDPRLAPLADNGGLTLTHALLDGSPAIDAGHDDDIATYDQRGVGFPRKFGAHVDLGAFESRMTDILFANGFE